MRNEYNPDGKDIRFIDSHYKDLFRIPDGGCVQIHYPDETVVKPCKFIDEYHTQVGYNVLLILDPARQESELVEKAVQVDLIVDVVEIGLAVDNVDLVFHSYSSVSAACSTSLGLVVSNL